LTWVTIGEYSGLIAGGGQESVSFNFNSAGLEEGTYAINLVINNSVGDPIIVPVTMMVGDDISNAPDLVNYFSLGQNYPNPFNPNTKIEFSLVKPGMVEVSVYNLLGQLIKTLHCGELSAGRHSVVWNGTDMADSPVASGTFFYRLKSEGGILNRKMVLMK